MAKVKQIAPIDVVSANSSPSTNQEEGKVPIVESDIAILAVKKLCILSVANETMSKSIVIDVPSEASSSSSSSFTFGMGLAFLKETPLQLHCYFPVDLHGTPLFYREAIDWGEWEWILDPGS